MRTAVAALACALTASAAVAETQTENVVAEQRTTVALRVAPAAAQALLPVGWESNAPAAGPNLSLIFMDRKLALQPDGRLLQSGTNRVMVVSMPAKNRASGETRNFIVAGFSDDPAGSPGAYKVYRPGSVSVTRAEESATGGKPPTAAEHWTARGTDGAVVDLKLTYTRGVPRLATFESKNYSAAEPDFYRIYRGQQATDPLRSPTVATDRVTAVTLTVKGGVLAKAIDGSERIVAVTATPHYARQTFLP